MRPAVEIGAVRLKLKPLLNRVGDDYSGLGRVLVARARPPKISTKQTAKQKLSL